MGVRILRCIIGVALLAGSVAGWKMLGVNQVLMVFTGFCGLVTLLCSADD